MTVEAAVADTDTPVLLLLEDTGQTAFGAVLEEAAIALVLRPTEATGLHLRACARAARVEPRSIPFIRLDLAKNQTVAVSTARGPIVAKAGVATGRVCLQEVYPCVTKTRVPVRPAEVVVRPRLRPGVIAFGRTGSPWLCTRRRRSLLLAICRRRCGLLSSRLGRRLLPHRMRQVLVRGLARHLRAR